MQPDLQKILFDKAHTLMEALPWIKAASDKTVVIKYGGAAMTDPELRKQVADDIVLMKLVGVNPVIVHGGGPAVSHYMRELGMEVTFKNGMRVTTEEAMDVVSMVLTGKVNKELVNAINYHGNYAVGISGQDGSLVTGQPIDATLGRAGKICKVDTTIVTNLINDGFIPVISSVGTGHDHKPLNINADVVASKLAAALHADKCIYLTDVDGLYRDFEDKDSKISFMTSAQALQFVNSPHTAGGMIPKVQACIDSVDSGVRRAHILNGTIPHALLLEIYTDSGVGTMITNEEC